MAAGTEGAATAGATATAAIPAAAPGCTVTWRHLVTGASLGICGMNPAEHEVTAACARCGTSADQRVCRFCWGSYAAAGLCGTCLEPLEITERKRHGRVG